VLIVVGIEEGQTVSKNSFDVLIPTIRKPGSEIWITFNPDLELSADVDLKRSVGMLVTPVPVILLIARFQLAEFNSLFVVILLIDAIGLIFLTVPLVVVVVLLVVISRADIFTILSLRKMGGQSKSRGQRRPGQSNIEIPFHV
jgi:hypothetical protein